MRSMFLLIVAAGMSICAQAQLDVSVTKVETQSNGQKQATLHVQNNSGKSVAAFNVATNLKYVNGETSTSQNHQLDFGYPNKTGSTPKLLLAGESIDEPMVFEKNVVQVTAKLTAVVYPDRTAEGDPEAIHLITEERQRYAERLAKSEPDRAVAVAEYAKDNLRCGPALCSSLRRLP
jgi:uncharacterized protein (TIGR02588 family)